MKTARLGLTVAFLRLGDFDKSKEEYYNYEKNRKQTIKAENWSQLKHKKINLIDEYFSIVFYLFHFLKVWGHIKGSP